MPIEHQTRFKVMITAYSNGPWSSIIEVPVTAISWDTKCGKPYWLSKLAYARTTDPKLQRPLLFSKTAAEAVATQIGRWKFAGPGPNGEATAKIVPVEVK